MTDIVEPFYLNNLLARVPGTTAPVSEFANGAPIELAWASNGTAYTVYAANDAEPVWSGTTTTCQLPGRTNTTTYVLAASVTGGPVSGTPDPSYSTILLYDAITVTITDPALTPLSLTTGSLTVSGATKVTGPATLADTTVGGTLSVTGAGSFGGGASATGLTVTGTTALAGGATLSSAVVNGALSVMGAATLASTLVDALSISGSITMMNPQSITPGVWRTASTDGLLVGAVWFGSNAGKLCSAQINGYADGIGWVYATGGNTAVNGNTMWGNANTFTVPVRRGTGFQTNVWQIDGKELDAPTAFFWVPFARNSTLTELTPEEVAALEIEVPLVPTSYVERWDARPAVDDLVAALVELAGDAAPSEAAAELTAAVMALATHED